MRAFWLSLLGFILMMCSCASKNMGKSVKVDEQISGEVNYMNNEVKIDTSKVVRIDSLSQYTIIEEELKITEYDKESGKPIKETNAKRKITQDSDKVVAEEENKSVTDCNGLKAEHFRDSTKKIDSEVKEESIGGQESFGKWLALSCAIAGIILYLWKRFK